MLELSKSYSSVREAIGMFDFSNLTKLIISGEDAIKFLDFLLPGNVLYLELNRIMHSAILNEQGQIVDVVYLYRFPDHFLLLGNPSQKNKVLELFKKYRLPNLEIVDITEEWGIISLEGPYSFEVVKKIIGFEVLGLRYLRFLETSWGDFSRVICARSGVTGEYGYRIFVPRQGVDKIKTVLLSEEPSPEICDQEILKTLCQEVRFPHFGIFCNEGEYLLELGLHWFADFRKDDYLAKIALERQKTNLQNRLVAFISNLEGDFTGKNIFVDELKIGYVKCCTFSPTLNKTIGYAMLLEEWACACISGYTIEQKIPIATATTPLFITKSVRTPIS